MAVDGLTGNNLELLVQFAQARREINLRVNSGGLLLARVHRVDAARGGEPAGLAIEGSDAFSERRVRDRKALFRGFGIDFDRVLLAAGFDTSLLNARFYFVESFGATGRSEVFVENLFGGGQAFLGADFVVLVLGHSCGVGGEDGNADGMRRAAVAGVAGDFDFVFEVGLVNNEFHFDHFAGDLLFFFVVLVPGVFDVAKLAVDAECAGDELHGGNQLVGGDVFEDLNVFELLGGGFGG